MIKFATQRKFCAVLWKLACFDFSALFSSELASISPVKVNLLSV